LSLALARLLLPVAATTEAVGPATAATAALIAATVVAVTTAAALAATAAAATVEMVAAAITAMAAVVVAAVTVAEAVAVDAAVVAAVATADGGKPVINSCLGMSGSGSKTFIAGWLPGDTTGLRLRPARLKPA
jgi:hypothetical protein